MNQHSISNANFNNAFLGKILVTSKKKLEKILEKNLKNREMEPNFEIFNYQANKNASSMALSSYLLERDQF